MTGLFVTLAPQAAAAFGIAIAQACYDDASFTAAITTAYPKRTGHCRRRITVKRNQHPETLACNVDSAIGVTFRASHKPSFVGQVVRGRLAVETQVGFVILP